DTTKVWDLKTHFRAALPEVITLPQQFKNHGYFVQGMGKVYHVGYDDPASWSVPWQRCPAPNYALAEDRALRSEAIERGDPDEGASAPRTNGPSPRKIKKASSPTPIGGNAHGLVDDTSSHPIGSKGPAYECADVPDNMFEDGKTAELAVKTLRE